MKIAIYCGSFDPIHTGHAMLANFIAQCNLVDEVWIMVSRRNPLKEHDTYADDSQRYEMAKLVAQNCKNVKASDFELKMPLPSYTIYTLDKLKEQYPEDDFCVVIGSDNLENFHKWKESSRILNEYGILVYPRPGFSMPEFEQSGEVFLNGAPEFGISSSLVREYIRSGWNISYFVPVEVAEFINENKLYR